MMKRLFHDHPASVGETYGEHMLSALGFSGRMFLGACACLVHAFLPFLCLRTGSNTIRLLHDRMIVSRNRAVRAEQPPAQGRKQPA